MPYQNAKIYFDGGHNIAIPMENFPHRKGRRRTKPKPPETPTEETPATPKEQFETAFEESRPAKKGAGTAYHRETQRHFSR